MTIYEQKDPSVKSSGITPRELMRIDRALTHYGSTVGPLDVRTAIEEKLVAAVAPRFNEIAQKHEFYSRITQEIPDVADEKAQDIYNSAVRHVADVVLRHRYVQNERGLSFDDVCELTFAQALRWSIPKDDRKPLSHYLQVPLIEPGKSARDTILTRLIDYDMQFLTEQSEQWGIDFTRDCLLTKYQGTPEIGKILGKYDCTRRRVRAVNERVDAGDEANLSVHHVSSPFRTLGNAARIYSAHIVE